MNEELIENYHKVRNDGGFYRSKRGLIKVWGKEAVQFLNGLITNDAAKLADHAEMSAAFPNAQGRALALVRVKRIDDGFLFETEETTREKVYNNLFRFTFAGDFFVEDLSEKYRYFSMENGKWKMENEETVEFQSSFGNDYFVPIETADTFVNQLQKQGLIEISDDLHEVLRIENGVPKYAVDVDETTIVPELGDDAISYQKGCYIGQEIIARIHFRGHVAKKLTGIILSEPSAAANGLISDKLDLTEPQNAELKSPDGKNAGRVTSLAFSPKLNQIIGLAYVRYDYLASGTELKLNEMTATVADLPFI